MNIVRNHDGDTVKSHIVNDFTVIIPKRMIGGIITNSENIQNKKITVWMHEMNTRAKKGPSFISSKCLFISGT